MQLKGAGLPCSSGAMPEARGKSAALVKAAQSAEQDTKKQKRAERFGTGEAAKAPLDPEEAERLAKRAARFAPSQPAAA